MHDGPGDEMSIKHSCVAIIVLQQLMQQVSRQTFPVWQAGKYISICACRYDGEVSEEWHKQM